MKKQYLFLTLALAFLPLYSMESTEDFNTQLNAHVASDAFEQNFINDFTEKSIEDIVETIKGLNQCFSSLSDENATKIQTIIREKLSDNQQKAIFQKLLEQQEWQAAVANAIWSGKTNGQWSALIEPLLNQENTDALQGLQSLIVLVPDDNPLSLKIHLALSFQPLLDNKNWQEAAQWILNNINEKQTQALTPYINQLIKKNKFDGLLVLQQQLEKFRSNDKVINEKNKLLYDHIQLAIEDFIPQETKSTEVISNQSVQNSNNNNNNNDDNFRMANVPTQPNLYSDSNNNNEKIENKNTQTATIITSDGQRYLNATEFGIFKSESVTIANLLANFQEEPATIPLEITSDQFNEILSLLKTIHKNKSLSNKEIKEIIIKQLCQKQPQQQEVTGKEGKQEEEPATAEYSVKKLITLLKTVDYLDIELLLDCSSDLLAEKLVTSDELKQFIEDPEYLSMLNQLPAQLNKKIVTKMPINCWILSNNLGIDFTHQTCNGHVSGSILSVALNAGNCLLASVLGNNTVNVYIIDPEKNNITFLEALTHACSVSSIEFSPDGRLLASAFGNIVNIYAINQQKITLVKTIEHTDAISSVAFSSDDRLLASVSKGIANIYAINQQKITHVKTIEHTDAISSVVFSPDGRLLASVSKGTVNIYAINQQDITHVKTIDYQIVQKGSVEFCISPVNHSDLINPVVFSPDGSVLIFALDSTVNIYAINQQDITHVKTINDISGIINSIVFSLDSSQLAFATNGGNLAVYAVDQQGATFLTNFAAKNKLFKALAFNSNGSFFASESFGNTLNVYKPQFKNNLKTLLFLTFCCNKNAYVSEAACRALDLGKYVHLQSIFDSLPEAIKNKLIEKGLVKTVNKDAAVD